MHDRLHRIVLVGSELGPVVEHELRGLGPDNPPATRSHLHLLLSAHPVTQLVARPSRRPLPRFAPRWLSQPSGEGPAGRLNNPARSTCPRTSTREPRVLRLC